MADLQSLSAVQLIVLATELCSKAEFEDLQSLQHQRPDVLGAEVCCRILLTFVSGNEEPANYVPLLMQLRGVVGNASIKTIDTLGVEELSEGHARRKIRQMRLQRLRSFDRGDLAAQDFVARFVVQQAYRIDAETGDLPAILQLVEPFFEGAELLREWLISNLLPLYRLDYEYYSEGASNLSLASLQNVKGVEALDLLLQKAKTGDGKQHIGRDLRGIVGPWMYGTRSSKRRKLSPIFRRASITAHDSNLTSESSGWQDVNKWILKTSLEDYDLGTKAVTDWDGPKDVDLGGYEGSAEKGPEEIIELTIDYGQAILAMIYATHETSSEAMQNSWRILKRVADVTEVDCPLLHNLRNVLPNCSIQPGSITGMPRSGLMFDSFLEPGHPLARPSTESLNFLAAILISLRILKGALHCEEQFSCLTATTWCLFATEQVQTQELHKILQNFARIASVEADWHSVREKILWLSRWDTKPFDRQPEEQDHRALFWQVSREAVETKVFCALLTAKQYKTAIALYLDPEPSPLPSFLIEEIVEHETLHAYDNASNSNRTRGGLKRASEILKAFGPYFPPSSPVNKIEHLLAATHSLSFYQLTLQHGVPFQPVSIRVHSDPISLVSKVLEQNSKAYTKLDDLLSIGRGLVAAGLPVSSAEDKDESTTSDDLESKMLESDHRITYDAIISALSSNDFDTAYSYILTRLSPSSQPSPSTLHIDDTSWRAAYAAGRHHLPPSASPSAQINTLSKRMELLSLALTLVPEPSLLPSMLATWQSCEDELNALRAREAAEEKAWDDRGDGIASAVPGGFGLEDRDVDMAETERERERRRGPRVGVGGGLHEDEAPMGLFDVARGAARAIGKSAFPLRGAEGVKVGKRPESFGDTARSSDEYGRSGDEGQTGRVRKRDMVSNMVTGGLVSGLGWVLGAQPVGKESATTASGSGYDERSGEN